MATELMTENTPDTLPSSVKSEIKNLADDLKNNPNQAEELIAKNKDIIDGIESSLQNPADFTQEDIQDYFTVIKFIGQYGDLDKKQQQNVVDLKNKIFAIDYQNVYATKSADIISVLLKNNIVSNVESGGTKRVQNPSQFYTDYLKIYANNDSEQMMYLSLEEKQNAVLDIYKQDMLDTVEEFLKKINASTEYNKRGEKYNIDAMVLMLSKESTGKSIYSLSRFLLESQQPSLSNFNNLSENKVVYSESVEQFIQTMMRLEMAYKNVLTPNGNIDNPDAYIINSSTFEYVPGSFEFYTEDDVLKQMVDFVDKKSAPSKYITFDVQGALHSSYFLTSNGTRREYPTVSGTKFVQANDPNYEKTTVFLGSYEKGAKSKISAPDYNINLDAYTTWLTFNEKTNTVQSMKEYLETPKTPLNILHDEIEKVGVDKIKEVQLGTEMYELYSAKLQKLYPTLIIVSTDGPDQLVLKENTTYTENKIVGEQYFFAGDTRTDNEKTQQLIGDNLSSILKELEILKNSKNVKVMIEGSASYLPAPQGTTNEKLAADRAENTKQLLIAAAGTAIIPDQIITSSSVNGPAYEGIHTQEEIADMEKNIYREHQYVKISIVHDVDVSKESSKKIIDLHQKKPVPDFFGFAMKLPPASRDNLDKAKTTDMNRKNTDKEYGKAYEEVDKKLKTI